MPGGTDTLPVESKASVHVSPSAPRTGAGNAVILCVERDPYVRELETYFLTEAGFGVTFAEDGLQALELAQQLHPTIVITEILVPKLDGLALCRRLKSDPATSDIAVLVFSLLAAERRAQDAGADAFLNKPLTSQGLKDAVRRLLARRAVKETLRHPSPLSTEKPQ
ncbi:MAG: response regulator [Gemmatimonadales bacterium]